MQKATGCHRRVAMVQSFPSRSPAGIELRLVKSLSTDDCLMTHVLNPTVCPPFWQPQQRGQCQGVNNYGEVCQQMAACGKLALPLPMLNLLCGQWFSVFGALNPALSPSAKLITNFSPATRNSALGKAVKETGGGGYCPITTTPTPGGIALMSVQAMLSQLFCRAPLYCGCPLSPSLLGFPRGCAIREPEGIRECRGLCGNPGRISAQTAPPPEELGGPIAYGWQNSLL